MIIVKQKKDYYDILGIDKQAENSEIKKAYRKLAKKYHPDSNAGNAEAEQRFKEVTEAYNVLSDPEKKKLYDKFGHAAFDESGFGSGSFNNSYENSGFSGSFGDGRNGFHEFHFEGGNIDDIFDDLFGGGFRRNSRGGNADSFRSEQFQGRQFRQRGQDLRADVKVTFDEAVFGCEKVISLQDPQNGKAQRLKVHIPAGIDSGKTLRLRGKGMPGSSGGDAGDLLLNVAVGEKPGFERKGTDVYTVCSIPFTTAVFGGEVRVQTLYGDVMCKIKEGTQSGSRIRLRGKGIVSMKDASFYGDQYVQIQIQVPKHLSPEAKQKLREYAYVSHEQEHYRQNAMV